MSSSLWTQKGPWSCSPDGSSSWIFALVNTETFETSDRQRLRFDFEIFGQKSILQDKYRTVTVTIEYHGSFTSDSAAEVQKLMKKVGDLTVRTTWCESNLRLL